MLMVDFVHFEQHYAVRDSDLIDHMWEVVEHLRSRCPVTHTDAPPEVGGSLPGAWVVTSYDDNVRVLQDPYTFSSDWMLHAAAGVGAQFGLQPPITIDPPLQRDFRHLLNPFLSPQA